MFSHSLKVDFQRNTLKIVKTYHLCDKELLQIKTSEARVCNSLKKYSFQEIFLTFSSLSADFHILLTCYKSLSQQLVSDGTAGLIEGQREKIEMKLWKFLVKICHNLDLVQFLIYFRVEQVPKSWILCKKMNSSLIQKIWDGLTSINH